MMFYLIYGVLYDNDIFSPTQAGNTIYNHIPQQPNQTWQVYNEVHTQLGYGYI